LESMQRSWGDVADFLTIYVLEAHPTDEWQMDQNERDGVCYAQPQTLAERCAIARDFVQKLAHGLPLLVDPIDNPADAAFAAWPERLYVIDEAGRVAFKGGPGPFGYHPEEVEAWLRGRFGAARAK